MYKLYWRAGTAAFAPEALLEEMGEPYERLLVERRNGVETPPEFRALNPLGYVPALVLSDTTVITESAACSRTGTETGMAFSPVTRGWRTCANWSSPARPLQAFDRRTWPDCERFSHRAGIAAAQHKFSYAFAADCSKV